MSDRHALFAYGSLQIPEVLEAVTGRSFPAEPARLEGHSRFCIAGKSYPGLCREPGAWTDGVLYRGLNAEALRLLDAFEDDFYRRERLAVATAGGATVLAETYVVPPEFTAILVRRPWSLEDFRTRALAGFLESLRHPRHFSPPPEERS